jgi:Zn-dependent peptidase ImmA (M78 family)
MPSPEGDHIMDSAFIHQVANELVQTAGTRNIKQIARSCSLDISETSRIKDMLGLLSLYFDKPLILINRQLDKQTKQMVCGYALGHYLEHQLLMDLHTLNKFLTIKDKHILLYEHNAFTSHLMLDSDEVYQMTKRKMNAAQIATAKRIHINLVLVKLLELHHLGYDLRHYYAQHHAFIKKFNHPAHFQFDSIAAI